MSDTTNMNLLQRINEVRKEISYIQKDKSVSTGGEGSYKAVTHDAVTSLIRPAMIKHGIVCWPNFISGESKPKEMVKDGGIAKQFRYEAIYEFTFANIDDPKDFLVVRIQSHAMDNADKAPGKAISYAKKYALLKLLEIETGEDDESRYAELDGLDESRLIDLLTEIREAANTDELKTAFATAYKAADEAKDKDAAKTIIKAKDARKAAIAKEAPI